MSAATAFPSSVEAHPAELPPAGAQLTVDLGAIVANWRTLVRHVGPGCTVAAVIKADGYGLGLLPVARALAEAGARRFYVALPEEGVQLDDGFGSDWPEIRIAVLSGPLGPDLDEFRHRPRLVPVLNHLGQLREWSLGLAGRPAILHIDTGMERLGFGRSELQRLADDPSLLGPIPVAGVMSHLACAEDPDNPLNELQRERFLRAAALAPAAPRSLAASGGSFLGPAFHFDHVRIGAALYGINPTPGRPNPMRPVVSVRAKVLQVREVAEGASVGYGASWTAGRPRRIATIALGYADGLFRSAGNRLVLKSGGVAMPVVGRISMDLAGVDVTEVPAGRIVPGQSLELIGAELGIDAFAAQCGTIGYEILTRLGPRLRRVYLPDAA